MEEKLGLEHSYTTLGANLKFYHVTVLHNILFSFKSCFSFFPTSLPSIILNKIIVGYDLCFDEFFHKISMYLPCSLNRGLTSMYGPGPYFFLSCCQKRNKSQRAVCFLDKSLKPRLLQSQIFQVFFLLLFRKCCQI